MKASYVRYESITVHDTETNEGQTTHTDYSLE